MLNNLLHGNFLQKRQGVSFSVSVLTVMLCFSIGIDLLEAFFQQSSFYFSESLLFSSFWTLFPPLLFIQAKLTRRSLTKYQHIALFALLSFLHLVLFPVLVWVLSWLFYYHTFEYYQTFQFGVTAHFFKVVLLYALPPVLSFIYKLQAAKEIPVASTFEESISQPAFLTSILVTDVNQQKLVLKIEEIHYFTANPPYVNIVTQHKKYLHHETLKSLVAQVDPVSFIRIHKSCILNLSFALSYKSRLNGDYDVTLKDGTELRVSRNYAAAFKEAFQRTHRLG